jgi:DMSO/TMAO reductase YedYZ heme-binding membrane subunit
MKKAWDDIKSFITVATTIAYIVLTFTNKMTPEFQNLYAIIVAFYFGTQAEKLSNKIKGSENHEGV